MTHFTTLATDFLVRHGLHGIWRATTHEDQHRIGLCNYLSKTISVDRSFIRDHSKRDVTKILLHEIAHAKLSPRYEHNQVWEQLCTYLGGHASPTWCETMRS